MSDMREVFDAMKAKKKERKQSNMKRNMDILNRAEVGYEVYNNGYQLNFYTSSGATVAFYPSTNKWVLDGKAYHGDAFKLLLFLEDY